MTVIPFRAARSRQRPSWPVQPPPALGANVPASSRSEAEDDRDGDRLRMRQNLGALAVVVFLVVFGVWLIDRLQAYSRTMACIESGHRSCLKLNVDAAIKR
jgi:hypothetical protein